MITSLSRISYVELDQNSNNYGRHLYSIAKERMLLS